MDSRYNIVHIDGKLRDPENNDLLGYTGIYVGSGPVARSGDPAKLLLTNSTREALQGDKLFPETTEVNTDFVPHAPASDVDATIIAVKEATVMGQYQLVALNRGSEAGLEPGHILVVDQRGPVVRDKYKKGGLAATSAVVGGGSKVQLPDEHIGQVMVFNTTPRMSYALVLDSALRKFAKAISRVIPEISDSDRQLSVAADDPFLACFLGLTERCAAYRCDRFQLMDELTAWLTLARAPGLHATYRRTAAAAFPRCQSDCRVGFAPRAARSRHRLPN